MISLLTGNSIPKNMQTYYKDSLSTISLKIEAGIVGWLIGCLSLAGLNQPWRKPDMHF
jgi:hypothetical protein